MGNKYYIVAKDLDYYVLKTLKSEYNKDGAVCSHKLTDMLAQIRLIKEIGGHSSCGCWIWKMSEESFRNSIDTHIIVSDFYFQGGSIYK